MSTPGGPSRARRRRRRNCLTTVLVCVALVATVGVGLTWVLPRLGAPNPIPGPIGRPALGHVDQPAARKWTGAQPTFGVDISFPQCGRSFRSMTNGYAIVGLDGGMPERPNPCFARQWAFAKAQAGSAIYVNTADNGQGDPVAVGRRMARGDLAAIAKLGVPAGTPIWLDVELPTVWIGSPERHRTVITEHMRALAAAGYPVGVYSAPVLWAQITGDATPGVPMWLGLGPAASSDSAKRACSRIAFGGQPADIVQRIGTASDGKSLDRNLTCPRVNLDGLVRPNR